MEGGGAVANWLRGRAFSPVRASSSSARIFRSRRGIAMRRGGWHSVCSMFALLSAATCERPAFGHHPGQATCWWRRLRRQRLSVPYWPLSGWGPMRDARGLGPERRWSFIGGLAASMAARPTRRRICRPVSAVQTAAGVCRRKPMALRSNAAAVIGGGQGGRWAVPGDVSHSMESRGRPTPRAKPGRASSSSTATLCSPSKSTTRRWSGIARRRRRPPIWPSPTSARFSR